MALPAADAQYLQNAGIAHSVVNDAGMICVIVPRFCLPPGYSRQDADLLLRLNPGYPDVPPDMWWFEPAVFLADGSSPPATDVREQHFGRTWQRWSRHLNQGQWRSGVDSVETFLALIRQDLKRQSGVK